MRPSVTIVGAGAAGLATAIFLSRSRADIDVTVVDGSTRPGAKILVSGGGRCNVTNRVVIEHDFHGGKRTVVRQILRAFPVAETIAFFEQLGVPLVEEPGGKLFPQSNRARDVLDALLRAARDSGVAILPGVRIERAIRSGGGFTLETSAGVREASAIVLATGGRSLPKTGSDGAGYGIAAALGHTLVAQTPALAPLILDPDDPSAIHAGLSGVSVDAEISAWIDGNLFTRIRGALLWTHFGISGPAALDVSRHWARAREQGRTVRLSLNFYPTRSFDEVDRRLRHDTESARASVRAALAADLPDAVARAVLAVLRLPADSILASLTREDRRRLVHALVEWPLPVVDTRGYNYAEVTAGGVALTEIDPRTMGSRVCPGLFLVGEILDVDGRLGGFNFQWAWASARVAARGLSSLLQT